MLYELNNLTHCVCVCVCVTAKSGCSHSLISVFSIFLLGLHIVCLQLRSINESCRSLPAKDARPAPAHERTSGFCPCFHRVHLEDKRRWRDTGSPCANVLGVCNIYCIYITLVWGEQAFKEHAGMCFIGRVLTKKYRRELDKNLSVQNITCCWQWVLRQQTEYLLFNHTEHTENEL